ncbi:MAG TPA: hypothetical protein VJU81_12145 [Methylomirabilota bacterium]|nr:hypothetical protein [Methylomirabilota bacterium]
MKRTITLALVALACLLASAPPAGAQQVSLPTLFSERARFAERTIIVIGTVMFASPPTGGAQRFTIQDGGATVDVVATTGPPVRVGARVEVEGVYKLGPNSIAAFRVTLR